MPTTAPTTTSQQHSVLIGEFELSFLVRVWWCSGEPSGWLWAAKGEDDMTGWISGHHLETKAEHALEAAVATLTRRFA